MRRISLITIAISFSCLPLKAQNTPAFNLTFNHLALFVKDVDRSVEFYKKYLHLMKLPIGLQLQVCGGSP